MKKVSLEKTINDNSVITDILDEYSKLKVSIKDSNAKLKELRKFITEEDLDKYIMLKDNSSKELDMFLLENPMLSEYIDEVEYNRLLNTKLEVILKRKVDLTKLNNGIECQHEFIKLNNNFMCIKCFIKEDDLDFQSDDLHEFLVAAAACQGMYIDEIDEGELGLLEQIKMDHKSLIENLKQQEEGLPEDDRLKIEETINSLENNKVLEYRNSIRKLRKEKLSIKK